MSASIKELSKYSMRNKVYIGESDKCACYFCLSEFNPEEIVEWTDEGETALCPKCKIDSVVGNSVVNWDTKFLEDASHYWFW